jgi:hypothetical protein
VHVPASNTNRARRRRGIPLALALLGVIFLAVGGTTWSAAGAPPTAPVRIALDSVTSDVTAPGGTPSGAVPNVLVQIGGTVHLGVSFYDASGAPASFSKDTTLLVTSTRGGLTQLTGTALKGATSATIDVRFTQAANQVSLTVSVPGRAGNGITPATSSPAQLFDVVSELQFVNASPNSSFQRGIGGDDSRCANATASNPVCGIAILPHGAQSSQVLLSLGACDSTYAGCGSTRGFVVQTLADLSGLYTKTDPATLLIKCDKSLCAGGAIQDKHLSFSLNGNDALQEAEPCPAKSIVGAAQTACVDYVQSKRDNSGDTLLYLLFTQDMRGSVR